MTSSPDEHGLVGPLELGVAGSSRRRVASRGQVRVGVIVLTIVVAVAAFGPLVAPHGATDYVGPPSSTAIDGALFGTDYLGQDVWSRFLLGGRSILVYASLSTMLGGAAGAAIGLVAAVGGGFVDELAMRSVDVVLAVPQFLLVLVAMTTAGPEAWLVVAAIAATTAPRVARVTHGAARAVVERDFVQVSEALGESRWRIVRADVLPNISGPLLVEASIRFTYAIGIVASLAFLGFTPDVNRADWGVMVEENRAAFSVQPWGVLLPMVAIIAAAVGAGVVADGLARPRSSSRDR